MVGGDHSESLFALGSVVQLHKKEQAAVLACERDETSGGLGEDGKSEPVSTGSLPSHAQPRCKLNKLDTRDEVVRKCYTDSNRIYYGCSYTTKMKHKTR